LANWYNGCFDLGDRLTYEISLTGGYFFELKACCNLQAFSLYLQIACKYFGVIFYQNQAVHALEVF